MFTIPFATYPDSQVEKHVRGFLPSLVKKHMGEVISKVGDIADVAIKHYEDYKK